MIIGLSSEKNPLWETMFHSGKSVAWKLDVTLDYDSDPLPPPPRGKDDLSGHQELVLQQYAPNYSFVKLWGDM